MEKLPIMNTETYLELVTLTQQLRGKDRATAQQLDRIYALHNELFPNRKEYTKGCGSCRARVYQRLLQLLASTENALATETPSKTIAEELVRWQKTSQIKQNMTLQLKKEYEGKTVTRTHRLVGNITFDPTKASPERYHNYYNSGFEDLFDVVPEPTQQEIDPVTYNSNTVVYKEEENNSIELLEVAEKQQVKRSSQKKNKKKSE